jgi:hypothetical protein
VAVPVQLTSGINGLIHGGPLRHGVGI